MKIDYSQFLNMIPEVSLMAILIIVFLADLFTAVKPGEQKKRQWEKNKREKVNRDCIK